MSQSENNVSSYAIIGFGKIGQALAKAFARNHIYVSVATTRNPESFASDAAAIGPEVIPTTLAEAVKADIISLLCLRVISQQVKQRHDPELTGFGSAKAGSGHA